MASDFDFSIENEAEFLKTLSALQRATTDLRIPFRLIASDFYRSQKIIFKLTDAGLYPPLGGFDPNRILANGETSRQAAERAKRRRAGIVYPLLEGDNQNIKDSTLTRTHRFSIFKLSFDDLIIGTNVPYGKFHQSDRPRTILPQRKFLFIDGGPNDASKSSRITGRRERWTNIVNEHLKQITTGRIL